MRTLDEITDHRRLARHLVKDHEADPKKIEAARDVRRLIHAHIDIHGGTSNPAGVGNGHVHRPERYGGR